MTYEQSESIAAMAPALGVAQRSVTGATKNSTNPHFRSDYADLVSVRTAALPALEKAGLSLTQWPVGDGERIGMVTQLTHDESGEWMRSTILVKPDKPGPQAAGSALSYLRRYGMASVLGIPQVDDDGNAAQRSQEEVRSERSHELRTKATEALNKATTGAKLDAWEKRLGQIKGDLISEDYKALAKMAAEVRETLEEVEGGS